MPDPHTSRHVATPRDDHQRGEDLAAAIIAFSGDAIISKTLDGLVPSWNAAAERIFGYAASDMIGRSISRPFPPDRALEDQLDDVKLSWSLATSAV